jgi:hypothetical protein
MITTWEDWSTDWECWDIQKSPAPIHAPELLWHPDYPEDPDEIKKARKHALHSQWDSIQDILGDGEGFERLLAAKDLVANYLEQAATKIETLNDEIEILELLSDRYEELSSTALLPENEENPPVGLYFLSSSNREGLTIPTDHIGTSWCLYHLSTGSFHSQTKEIAREKGSPELSLSDFAVLYQSTPEAKDYAECNPDVYSDFVENGLYTFRASRPCSEIVADIQTAVDRKTEPLLVQHRTETFLRFRLDLIEAAVYRFSLFGDIGSVGTLEIDDIPLGASLLDHERTIQIGRGLKAHRLEHGNYPSFNAYGQLLAWASEVIYMSEDTARDALVNTKCWANTKQGKTEGLEQTMRKAEQYAERYGSER